MNKVSLIFLFSLLGLSYIHSQTTGPTQPEASSFTPIGSDDMVNLYTGDFNYNIPLMVIPGPDGGYPINLAYNSNVGMDQAASWVGLGWNLNTGAIQRNLRGLPDDFKGDEIKKTTYIKPSRTISFTYTPKAFNKEFLGASLKEGFPISTSYGLYYNNYSGFGINTSLSGIKTSLTKNKSGDALNLGLNLKFGNQEGISLSPKLSYDYFTGTKNDIIVNGLKHSTALGFNLNSKQGFSDLNLSHKAKKQEGLGTLGAALVSSVSGSDIKPNVSSTNSSKWGSISFASAAPLQSLSHKRTTLTTNFSFAYDPKKKSIVKTDEVQEIFGSYMSSWIDSNEKSTKSFGAMYMTAKENGSLTDFYRENGNGITKKNMITPVSILTYDVFSIQGHGVGGSFRAYQNSIGRFSDPEIKSTTTNTEVGIEAGFPLDFPSPPPPIKIGLDLGAGYGKSYSGPWKEAYRYLEPLNDLRFKESSVEKPLYEPFYFKMIGESAPMSQKYWEDMQKETPIAFNINRKYDWESFEAKAKAFREYNRTSKTFLGSHKDDRTVRSQHIEYFTKDDLSGSYLVDHIVNMDTNTLNAIDYNLGKEHHINGVSVLKTNGVRYNYFLPAYNHTTEKVSFSVEGVPLNQNPKVITDADVTGSLSNYEKVFNGAGEDHYYSKEVIPAYAHTYFITSILSQDYIDVDDNGPTENDLGTYVKFNYEKVPNYEWRFPFAGAYYSKGYQSNPGDDKASYQRGTKDLYYVNSIETKTHIAVFKANDSKLQGVNGKKQKELKLVALFSKNDPNYTEGFYYSGTSWPNPIQQVHLDQNYHLRKNTPNSTSGYTPALDSLHFTYYNSSNGENSKYAFKYGTDPNYEDHQQDRWGAYHKPPTVEVHENPYTYQQESYANRDAEASAWLLDEIEIPSKGKIDIDYEKDDYAYVQDKKATSYIELIGTGDTRDAIDGWELKNEDSFLFFKTPFTLDPDPIKGDNQVKKMIKGLKYLRFRSYVDLKYSPDLVTNVKAADYVEGYAEIQSAGMLDANTGYVQIKPIKPKTGSPLMNPIRLAALQYIRKSRPDLSKSYDLNNPVPVVMNYIPDMLNEASVILAGYYKTSIAKGWAKELNTDKPSFIRLVMPRQKFGGGSRVRQITMSSNDRNNRIYGQTYSYDLEDGTSSGVAEFEPILGIEENVFTQPVWYKTEKNGHEIIFSNEKSFLEEPVGAGLYPSANVGYSRVEIRNLEETDITLAQSGINVSEFYTAKDFPTKVTRSGALFAPYWAPVYIPFIGKQKTKNYGFSMGHSFTLNNSIYGRPKSVATYPYTTNNELGEPIQKSVYTYRTNPDDHKQLDNFVPTLKKEGEIEDVHLGKEVDFYIDEIESNTQHIDLGSQINMNIQYPAFLPSWFPKINTSREGTRYLSTTKITYNQPILESISQYKDGAEVKTSNLYYDYETGEPIITSVTNEWNQPVYTYNFPAHWSYDAMKGAYKNYRSRIYLASNPPNSGRYSLKDRSNSLLGVNVEEVFQPGDVLIRDSSQQLFYVDDLNTNINTIGLKQRNGQSANFVADSLTIIKSGYKNLQSTKKGKIVSLEDLSIIDLYTTQQATQSQAISAILAAYNTSRPVFSSKILGSVTLGTYNSSDVLGPMNIPECNSEIEYSIGYSYQKATGNLTFNFGSAVSSECSITAQNITLPDDTDFSNFRFVDSSYEALSQTVKMIYVQSGHLLNGQVFSFTLQNLVDCFICNQREPITVLHADATEFSDQWNFNYNELSSQTVNTLGTTLSNIAADPSKGNHYAYGIRGIWRPKRTSAYLIDRKQTGVNGSGLQIDKDGEYDTFYPFDWTQPINYNERYNWRWVNEVTKYNVNGSSKEGRNRLDIHAASLFGYENHLVTASASNSKTTDIAFDSFEDYQLDQYNYIIGSAHGNFNFTGNIALGKQGHTGSHSLYADNSYNHRVDYNNLDTNYFIPERGKKYVISAWTKNSDIPDNAIIHIKINGATIINSFDVALSNQFIDGWKQISGVFEIPLSATTAEIIFSDKNDDRGSSYDDIRIQPFNSGMETYVYDPTNYRLLATLSNQNYATFYNYDEEGNLTQTKVETERGIKTISSNQNNIKK